MGGPILMLVALLNSYDANTMIRLRVSYARVSSVEYPVVGTQVEGHKGPQAR